MASQTSNVTFPELSSNPNREKSKEGEKEKTSQPRCYAFLINAMQALGKKVTSETNVLFLFTEIFNTSAASPNSSYRLVVQSRVALPPSLSAQLPLCLHETALHPHTEVAVVASIFTVQQLCEGALHAFIDVEKLALLGRHLTKRGLVD